MKIYLKTVDIKDTDIDICVDGQSILYISQVSNKETINLFLYPRDDIVESIIHKKDVKAKCTHEIIVKRE